MNGMSSGLRKHRINSKIGSRTVWLYRKCIKTDLTVEQRCMADLCPLLD